MLLGSPNHFRRSATTGTISVLSCNNSESTARIEEDTMDQANANGGEAGEEGNPPNGRGAAQQPGGLVADGAPNEAAPAVAVPAAALVAVVVANPIMAVALAPPPGLVLHPQFDVEAALSGPPATRSNRNFEIHARIP